MTGVSIPVFIGLTVVLMGGAGWMTGQALARGWKSAWLMLPYGLLLGLADRFFTWSLFHGDLLSPLGFVIDSAVILTMGVLAYRFTRARKMVAQYPWLYDRTGLLSWCKKPR
jgi:branched-chain amino acid transport system ATP-binding protein